MPRVWRMFRKSAASAKAEAGFSELTDTADISADTMQKKVKELGLTVQTAQEENAEVIFAHKGKLSLIAPQVLHVAILTILIGALLTSMGVKMAPGYLHR